MAGAERTSAIKISIVVDEAKTKATARSLQTFLSSIGRVQSSALKDQQKLFAAGDAANLASHKTALGKMLALDQSYYEKLAGLRKKDESDAARSAGVIRARTITVSANIEQRTRSTRAAIAGSSSSSGSSAGPAAGAAASGTVGQAVSAQLTGLAALDRELKAGVVSREQYVRSVLAMAQREGLSQDQLVRLYTKAKAVKDQVAAESAAASERESARVQRATQSEIRAVDSEMAAERRAGDAVIAEEKRVGAAWDAGAKHMIGDFEKVRKSYLEMMKTEERGAKAAGGSSHGAGPHPIDAGDIANAIAASAIFSEIKTQLQAGIEQVGKFDDAVNEADMTFGEYSGHVKDWAKTTAESIGVSETAAISAASKMGLLLTNLGLTSASAAVMSTKMIALAANLGAVAHVDTDKALDILYKGLAGSTRGLKALGISMSETTLKDRALRDGLISSRKDALDPATKAQAAYSIMTEQGARVQGEFAKRSGDVQEAQKLATAALEDAQKKLGQEVTPAYTSFLNVLTDIFRAFKDGPTDLEKTAGALLAMIGAGGAIGLFASKLTEIRALMAGIGLLPAAGGLAAGGGKLAGIGGASSGVGGAILATPALVAAGFGLAINHQNDVVAQNELNTANLPPYIETAGAISDLADRKKEIQDRLSAISNPDHQRDIRTRFSTSGDADIKLKQESDEAAALAKELANNEKQRVAFTKVYNQQFDQATAEMRKADIRHHQGPGDPKITKKVQPPSAADVAAAEAERKKAAEDSAAARETLLKGQHEDLQKNLDALETAFKSGKGDDSAIGIITKIAIRLKDVEVEEAKAAYAKSALGDPKHTMDAAAQLSRASKSADRDLTAFRQNSLPQMVAERNKAIDAGTIKLIDERLKNYSVNDTEAQRTNVLRDVGAMRYRLRTPEAQQEALDKVTEAREKVGDKILESDEKYFEQVSQNRKLSADLEEKRLQASLDILNAQLDEARELPERKAIRVQIRDAEISQAVSARKAAFDDITREAEVTAAKQHGKLTPEQMTGFQTRFDLADQGFDTSVQTAGTASNKGTKQDQLDQYARIAKGYRDQAEVAKTPEEKANLITQAGGYEIAAAGDISPSERKAMDDKNRIEENGYRAEQLFQTGGTQLATAAKTGDKDTLRDSFTTLNQTRVYSADDQHTAEMIQREVKMLIDAAELPGSKLVDGSNKTALRDRLKNLEGLAYSLGDVPLMLSIDADVKKLDEKLMSSAEKLSAEFREAILSGVSAGVETFSSTLLDILAHKELGKRDPYAKGQNGRRLMEDAGNSFLRSEAGGVQKSISQGLGKMVNDNLHDLFKPKTDSSGKVVGPSTVEQAWNGIKDSGIGRDIEASAQKAATFLHIGGKDAGASIIEGAASIYTAASALGAAMGGHGKKRKFGGLIGTIVGGIAGSFIGGPGGGWKIGSTVGGQLGGMLGFASGGVPPLGRMVMVGEHGPELARFDSPARIYSHQESRQIVSDAGKGGTGNTTHNGPLVSLNIGTIHDRVDADHMFNRLTDHLDSYIRRS